MKKIISILPLFLVLILNSPLYAQMNKLQITIGENIFTATLSSNEASKAFVSMLPLDINMTEMGGYEKYHHLPQSLPGSASNVGTTYEGDIMIWSGNCLVLFYTTRSTSYSYIRIGRIDNTSGLREALGPGNVRIRFQLEGNTTANENIQSDEEIHKVIISAGYLEVTGEVNHLTLYTLSGGTAGSSKNNRLTTGNLIPGLYLLKIKTRNKGTIIRKIIIS